MCVCVCVHHSRKKVGKLGDELLFPPAGKMNHLPAAFDTAANTRSLLFTATTGLKHNDTHREASHTHCEPLGSGLTGLVYCMFLDKCNYVMSDPSKNMAEKGKKDDPGNYNKCPSKRCKTKEHENLSAIQSLRTAFCLLYF